MSTSRRAARAGIIGAMGLALFTACGDEPRAPTGPSPSSASPASAVPTAIRLEGPSSLALGTSAQYRVAVSFSDGTARDVTNQSSILARSPWLQILNVANDGLVTAGSAPAEETLTAHYPAGTHIEDSIVFGPGTLHSSALRVLVLEPGTFRVSGVVTESGRPFPEVRVTVVAGRRAGLQTQTASDGTYAFYGLAGPTELAVSDEGLQTQVRSIVVTDHQTVDFNVQPLPGYDSLGGDWKLTLSASPSCGSAIPAEAATRTFQARISQRGSKIILDLSSPTRVILSDYPSTGFGGVEGNSMSFYLQRGSDEESDPPRWVLLDMLEPRRFIGISGPARGQREGHTITGTLSGYFSVYRSTGPNYFAPGTRLESSCLRKIGEHPDLHSFRLDRN